MIMKLDTQLFNEIAKNAEESPRLRMNYDLRKERHYQEDVET